ncbi:uncharacterized protein LOC122850894 [Aphidius gifuensis]|uniref:uncharacterized protein LOC122850894 n=1 Tax=Aphidius gifuensis TaxID=684658 RepID=UPI001CDCA042|nr:uncharacterized protein LOC122850894 [Aphidius gifuensis]
MGQAASDKYASDIFKPIVTPLEKLLNQTTTTSDIKKEIKNEPDNEYVKKEQAKEEEDDFNETCSPAVKMSIDIFGRQSKNKNSLQSIRGPPGDGFKRTSDGHYNINNKRLCNVADALESNDATSVKITKTIIKEETRILYQLNKSLRDDVDNNNIIANSLQSQFQEFIKNYRLEFETTQKSSLRIVSLHKPARRNYTRRHVDIKGLDETWQADLVDMQAYTSVNQNYKYLLTIIDIFSKFAWTIPIKSKTGKDVTAAMKSVLDKGRIPKNLHVDQGKEFYNKEFEGLMQKHKIHMYSTYSNLIASVVERFNRTLKNKMWEKFTYQGSYKWLEILPHLLENYNNSKHRTIKMKPIDVTKGNKKQLLRNVYKKFQQNRDIKNKFKIGDKVRISKYKTVFEKGYTPNFTTEIFTIKEVKYTDPVTYKLIDYKNNPIEGGFYEEELTKVKYPDIYLVEKIVKKRGDKLHVKWLGFDDTHNSWINKSDL